MRDFVWNKTILPKCYENDDNLNNIRNETTKQDCLTEDEAWNTYQALEDFIEDFYSDFNAYNCALPCKVISFSFDIDYCHSNSIITQYQNRSVEEEGGFKLQYYYKSLKVEEKLKLWYTMLEIFLQQLVEIWDCSWDFLVCPFSLSSLNLLICTKIAN